MTKSKTFQQYMVYLASQITSLTNVYSTVYSGTDLRKHQSSASLAFVRGIHRWPANSPHNWPVTRKIFPFDDVIMSKLVVNLSSLQVELDTHVQKHFHETKMFIFRLRFNLNLVVGVQFVISQLVLIIAWRRTANIKMSSDKYREPHVKDKTVSHT